MAEAGTARRAGCRPVVPEGGSQMSRRAVAALAGLATMLTLAGCAASGAPGARGGATAPLETPEPVSSSHPRPVTGGSATTPESPSPGVAAGGAGSGQVRTPSTEGRPPGGHPLAGRVVPLAGRVVVLDAGHNGGNRAAPDVINRLVDAGGIRKPCNTTGTATNAGYPESAFTFDVVTRAAALLRARGARVVLTRHSDTGVGPCIDQRARIANDARADLAVSVHADGAAAGVRGFHVIEPALAPNGGNAAILGPSARAAVDLRAAFAAATGQPFAGYPGGLVRPGLTRRADLGGLNLARVPAVFIECANMRNPVDAAEVSDPAWRQRAANGLVDGIAGFLTAG